MDGRQLIGDITLLSLLRSSTDRQVSEEAAAEFHSRYMEKLMSLVGRNLAARLRSRVDPDDIVQSVFRSWFAGTKKGRFKPSSHDEVWVLLSVVALNKVRNRVKFHNAKKRDARRTESGDGLFAAFPEPTQADALEFMEMIESIAGNLDERQRRTLELIIEGRKLEEIARDIGRTTKSVSRYKQQIGSLVRTYLEQQQTQNFARKGDGWDDDSEAGS